MTLRELILKYTLEEIMPYLKGHRRDGLAGEEQYLYVQAWSELQYLSQLSEEDMANLYERELSDLMMPQEPIRVHWVNDWEDEAPYISAYDCEGDYWTSLIVREMSVEADIDECSALAAILWHLTYWGFSDYKRTHPFKRQHPDNIFHLRAIELSKRQYKFDNPRPEVTTRKIGGRTELSYSYVEGLFAPTPRRSRIKQKRFVRIDKRIEALDRMDELCGQIDGLVINSSSSAKELEFLYACRSEWYNFETRAYDRKERFDYAMKQWTLLKPYIRSAEGIVIRISTIKEDHLTTAEKARLAGFVSAYGSKEIRLIFGNDNTVYPGELSWTIVSYADRGLKPYPRRKQGLCSSPYPKHLAHYIVKP